MRMAETFAASLKRAATLGLWCLAWLRMALMMAVSFVAERISIVVLVSGTLFEPLCSV